MYANNDGQDCRAHLIQNQIMLMFNNNHLFIVSHIGFIQVTYIYVQERTDNVLLVLIKGYHVL